MTSGNLSNEPIFYKDNDAYEGLKEIADYFLTYNRDINIRIDDSVLRVFDNKQYSIRRSRGFVPEAIIIDGKIVSQDAPVVLACGGELKNTFCINRGNEFYLSHHIGDLNNMETCIAYDEGINHFQNMLNIKPSVVTYDMHPDYYSTKYASKLQIDSKISILHHHAHIASCMADNNISQELIGVVFDGTGYGDDGNIWGGEFFVGNLAGFKRIGHIDYIKMPGGDMAIKEPWRMALSWLHVIKPDLKDSIFIKNAICFDSVTILDDIPQNKLLFVINMLEKNINCPLTSSVGRLFDAVSSLIGVRNTISYEGQAAIELENIAYEVNSLDEKSTDSYDFIIADEEPCFIICPQNVFIQIMADIKNGIDKCIIASKFHETISNLVLESCVHIRKKTKLNEVALSGGVFQNMTLLKKCCDKLKLKGFKVFTHSKVPTNDGGISLGQAVMALAKMTR